MAEHTGPRRNARGQKAARLLAALGVATAASVIAGGVAGAVTTATIQLSSTSAAATQVTYTVGFTSPGALASGTGTFTLTAPTGTTFSSTDCDYSLYNATTTRSGGCPLVTVGSGGKTVTIATNITFATGNTVEITAEGVANPPSAGSDTLKVTTNAGGTFDAAYTLTAATAVTGLTLTASSTSAGASEVRDVLSFTATNGLTNGISQIEVTAPTGSTFSSTGCMYTLFDTSSERSSGCLPVSVTGGNQVAVTPEIATAPGDPLRLTIAGVTNPSAAGADSIALHTTSDPAPASVPFDVTASTAVSKLSLITSAKGAGATAVTDQVTFVPSNALTSGTSQITITAPTGSTLSPDGCEYSVYDSSTKHGSSCLPVTVSKSGNGVTLTTETSIASGSKVIVTLNGLSNPTAKQTGTLTASTSSDPTPASVADDTSAPTAVTSFSLTTDAHAVSATGVTYIAKFKATNGLTAGTSAVTLTGPSGTVFPTASCGIYVMYDLTTDRSNGCLSATVAANVVTITSGITVNRGNNVEVAVNDVTSTTAPGSHAVGLSTTSDTKAVPGTLSLTTKTKVKDVLFSSNDTSASALRATYTLTFTATGGLNRTYGRIDVSVPAGAILPASGCGLYVVTDDTTGQSNGCVGATLSGQTVSIQAGVTVNPGDQVTIAIHKVDNPAKSGKDTVKVSTSSDAIAVSSAFQVKAEAPLKDVTITPTSHAAGATGVSYKITFVVTGGLTANTSTITITPTTGATTVTFTTPTTPTDSGCRVTNGNTTSGTSWACAQGTPSTTGTGTGTGTGFTVTPDESASTGNGFYIIINNVKNPTKVGTAVFKVHSSFDPKPVKVSVPITAPTGVKQLSFKATSYSATATEVTYNATFVVTGGLTGRYSKITLSAPPGTVLPANTGCGIYNVTDKTNGQNGSCETVALLNGGTTAVMNTPIDIRPGDAVNLAVNGVANPATAGTDSVSVSTSSDQKSISAPFTITAKSKVSAATLKVTGSATTPYKATIAFTATNGLTGRYSTITMTAPSGTVLPANSCDYSVLDTTDSLSGGCPSIQGSGSTTTIVLPVTIRPKDGVQVVIATVTGTKPSKMSVSTSSDPTAVSA